LRPEAAVNMREFLAWITGPEESSGDAWLRYSRKLARSYAWRVELPDDFADEVMIEAGVTFNTKYRETYREPALYIFGVAKHMLPDFRPMVGQPLPPDLPDPGSASDPVDEIALRRCFGALSPSDQQFMIDYIIAPRGAGRVELGQRQNASVNAMRTRASRLRTRIEECLSAKRSRASDSNA
jgi:hypothetical protein